MAEKASYELQHIILFESNFKRNWNIEFDNPEFADHLDIEVEDSRYENFLNVSVNLTFSAGIPNENQVSAFIKMGGVFSTDNTGDLNIDQFATINAPAIIFPFIREHLSSLSLKAGINPILLSPVNFVRLSQNKKKPKKV